MVNYIARPNTIFEVDKNGLSAYIRGIPSGGHWDTVSRIILHNSGGDEGNGIKVPQSYQRYHIQSNGWADIGYHAVITPDGKVYIGRNWFYIGAHAHTSGNRKSLGICMTGNFNKHLPTQEQINSFAMLCAVVRQYKRITEYSGHRWVDTEGTDCPGSKITLGMIQTWSAHVNPEKPKEDEDMAIQYYGEGTSIKTADYHIGDNNGKHETVYIKIRSYNDGKNGVKVNIKGISNNEIKDKDITVHQNKLAVIDGESLGMTASSQFIITCDKPVHVTCDARILS